MEYIKEEQILCKEELRAIPLNETDEVVKTTILFRNNIKLAHYLVAKISNPRDNSVDKDDILQEAYLGLWKACRNFDESKGFEFSTYAVPVIQGQIYRMLRESQSVRVPRSTLDIRNALYRQGLTLPLSEEDIKILEEKENIPRERILNYSDINVSSLEVPVGDKETSYLGDLIPDEKSDVQQSFSEDEIEEIIEKIIEYVKEPYRDLVEEWIYSMLNGEKVNQMTLAAKYNRSQAHVSRIISNAIEVIKKNGNEVRALFGL